MTATTSVSPDPPAATEQAPRGSALEVLAVAARLGVTSFGGPVAHLGYFREEYVKRRGWVDEAAYADLLALCQTLPGPASSQVGISLGIIRAGLPGGVAAWLVAGPSRVLDRHGFLVSIVVALVVAAAVAALWFAGRPVPGLGNG